MANFVEALGRSQALTSAISGIQGIQQGELAIKNQESQQAINEYNLKKIKEEEAAGERLLPIDPAFGRLTPSVKDFWGKIAQPYMVKGTSGENYIKAKDMPRLMQTMEQDKAFRLHTYKLTLTDTMTMQQKLNKLLEQAKTGEGETKLNEKQITELQADIAKVNQQKYYLDNVIAMHEGKQAKEDYTLNPGDTRFSGATNAQVATGGVKPIDLPAGLDEFETVEGVDPKLRGTVEYKKAYMKFLQEKDNVTTKQPDVTDKDEKTYSRILAQSNSDAWRRTQAKFPKSGMSFNFTTGEMSTGGGGDPAALDFYEQERNKAVTARLKKVGLHKKYGDLHTSAPASGDVMDAMPPAGQHKGKVVKDTETGKRYKSDGKSWVEVK